ncbi:uncharacterized protein CC84DRAFT_1117732 [Paraphaeosphaeria sporulosa]|uniref:CCZ1/INTU/HSP4 first Longin domain-containing protein n=1 Tax=Paraphaeosphaeria sporulosa TaxID=1460663 RepID=A0A177CKP7_9PLEO|nr:uncharacterized protein CC84DRAFT_1117732 [Paraphaeosphaeria sporulosa]OAG07420.1 hypothetical protein CC84DRAFT_1117732 [Paraphaeosphaeria sporulosa]
MSSTAIPKVVPAHLSFLAIYNPDLGRSDETFHNQIVFYHSKAAKARSRLHGRDARAEQELREHENEKLRQVGLAQGMVGFARSFSNGAAVDSVETQKSRIVLHELEEGWWILASIDLTQLPAHHAGTGNGDPASQPSVEYSSREVSPPALLIQQLIRAHNIFLLHHGITLDAMLDKHDRTKFCNILEKYWSRFASTWDVLLHGSPAVGIYNGMKLAAGGELGMGVGEEEWGSGERLVLEDFVQKTEGLVDFMVSRFGEPSPLQDPKKRPDSKQSVEETEPWIGSGRMPTAADGIVFSGVGAVAKRSLRDLSHWIETIYSNGDHAYGVGDNPTTDRRKRRRRIIPSTTSSSEPAARTARLSNRPSGTLSKGEPVPTPTPGIPPDLIKNVETSLDKASSAVDASGGQTVQNQEPLLASLGDTETWMKYLTLGYGTAWGSKKSATADNAPTQEQAVDSATPEAPMRFVEPEPDVDHAAEKLKAQIQLENTGYFAIGLKGDLDDGVADDSDGEGDWNKRTLLRNVHVELTDENIPATPGTGDDDTPQFEKELSLKNADTVRLRRLRPVIYVHRPFIYTFLFRHRTESLTIASFYRNLHTYFSPLHRPLTTSTCPSKVFARISGSSHPYTTTSSQQGVEPNAQPIYDLVYDPRTLTVHSSIPNIPDPGTLIAEGLSSDATLAGWSRVEALNVHSQILATVTSTRRSLAEIERTCKTSRSWWVVWMRLPPSQAMPSQSLKADAGQEQEPEETQTEFLTDQLREAILIRRARDATAPSTKSAGSRFASSMWKPAVDKTGGAAAGWGPRGLAEGIGIDARRYVEGLLSLNR